MSEPIEKVIQCEVCKATFYEAISAERCYDSHWAKVGNKKFPIKYRCHECGKLYDRTNEASDCCEEVSNGNS